MLGEAMQPLQAVVASSIPLLTAREHALAAAGLSRLRHCDPTLLQQLAEAARPGLSSVPASDMAAMLMVRGGEDDSMIDPW